jgi:hypothetical protein
MLILCLFVTDSIGINDMLLTWVNGMFNIRYWSRASQLSKAGITLPGTNPGAYTKQPICRGEEIEDIAPSNFF